MLPHPPPPPMPAKSTFSFLYTVRDLAWFCLWAALLASNAFVYSFSSMKSLENVRLVFWVLAPLIFTAWYCAFVQNNVKRSMLLLVCILVVVTRFFYGRLCIVSGMCEFAYSSSQTPPVNIQAVVFTEESSNRRNFVEGWFSQHVDSKVISLRVDTDNPPPGTYQNELAYPGRGCENTMLYHQHLIAYVYRIKRFMLREMANPRDGDENDWWLMMESDAEPVYPETFQRTLLALTTYTDVDFVFLDFRNIAADFASFIVYAGMNGVLVRRKSFPRMVAELRYDYSTCVAMPWPMSPDALFGRACKHERLKCFSQPLLIEHGFPSSLEYGRDVLLGEQSSNLWEWWFTNLTCTVVVLLLYWKKHVQWRIAPVAVARRCDV